MSINCGNNWNMLLNNQYGNGCNGNNPLQMLFSGTNSIFGCNNFYGNSYGNYYCGNGEYNIGTMIGYNIMNSLLGLGNTILSNLFCQFGKSTGSSSSSSSAAKETATEAVDRIKTDIESLKDQKNAILTKWNVTSDTDLEKLTINNTKEYEAWNELNTTVTNGIQTYNSNKEIIEKLTTATVDSSGNYTINNQTYTEAQIKAIKEQIKTHEENVKKLETLKAAKDKKETELKEAKDEIKKINERIENAEKQLVAAQLDAADGDNKSRTKADKFAQLINLNAQEYAFQDGKSASDVKEGDLQYILAQYSTAGSDEEKKKWGNLFKTLYNDPRLDVNLKNSRTQTAYKLIEEYLTTSS